MNPDMRRRQKKSDPLALLILGGILMFIVIVVVFPWLLIAIVVIVILYIRHKQKSDRKRRDALLWAGDIDAMTGEQFEQMLSAVFDALGYRVEHTGKTGDYGVDLILEDQKCKIAVQAKRYSSNVSNSAVQEVYTGMRYYKATEGMVITNSHFTAAAHTQASTCGVRLVSREELFKMIEDAKENIKS